MRENYDTYAEIDLDAMVYNIKEIKKNIGDCKIMAVLKADAYGHKATEVFQALVYAGVKNFGTANLFEALELRNRNQEVDILVFGRIAPANIEKAIENHISMSIYSKESWEELKRKIVGKKFASKIKVHIKLNTGFNRLGFTFDESCVDIIREIYENESVFVEGAYTHFALTNLEEDKLQFSKFMEYTSTLEALGMKIPIKHIADSIAGIDYPWARLDMIRLGAVMYGLKADREGYKKFDLKTTIKFWTTISQIRDIEIGEGISYDYCYKAEKPMRIATLAFGYADGYPRRLWNKAFVMVNGVEAPFTGLMCMDQCMIDIGKVEDAKVGDKVLIYDGNTDSPVSLAKISVMAGTNKNDIVASLARRVPRIYKFKGSEYVVNQLL